VFAPIKRIPARPVNRPRGRARKKLAENPVRAIVFRQMEKETRMMRFLAVLALTLGLVAPAARADEASDIRAVIGAQLEAFRADDWAGAFAHASPMIQGMFRTPEGFGRMVRGGYPMVWRPARVETGPLEQGPGGPVQLMFFEDAKGARYVAAYQMKQIGGAWRIDGVQIRKAPDASV